MINGSFWLGCWACFMIMVAALMVYNVANPREQTLREARNSYIACIARRDFVPESKKACAAWYLEP